ncbi:hypothetical protein ACQ4M4_06500 [Leptolyngbya sp. AN02str]|uniref:hypothetical protein n=1 Tax=Leptolyngbya sp. AN02str TaxID=3423363 RepID=UPI003D321200
MKSLLIQFSLSPCALTMLVLTALLGIALPYTASLNIANAGERRDEFPERRRGGGTHWRSPNSAEQPGQSPTPTFDYFT